MQVREAAKLLRKVGFVKTDHHRHWRFKHADGRVVTLPKSKRHDIYGYMEQKVKAYGDGRGTVYDRQEA